MAEDRVERKVTVILATDVVGYSSKIEQNETQTLQTLKACREIIEGLIGEHQGRVFNTAGDSVLAEFPSAVEAVLCASEFQRTIKERNDSVDSEAEQMEFRVGINMGDVVIEGDNLYGEGVNVAARLEALAQPGGICLSKNVHDIVYNKMNLSFTDLGEQQVKDTVVHAVDVSLDGTGQRKLPGTKKAQSSTRMAYLVAGLAIAALIVGGGVWWSQSRPDFEPADQTKFAYELPDKPSIAILPFDNLTGDSEQDYIGDGLSENLIAVLATDPNLFVVARNSSFTYKGKATKVQEVAEQLGVRYVLEGSVQKSGEKLRVTAQLVDAVDGKHLWSERYDRKLDDLFALQDEITNKIFEAMQVKLAVIDVGKVETRLKYAGSPETYRIIMLVRAHWLNVTVADHKEGERLLTELYNKDPENALVIQWLGWYQFQKLLLRLTKDPKQTMALAREYGEKGRIGDGSALLLLSWLDLFARDYDSALGNAGRAAELSPSSGMSNAVAGDHHMMAGQPEKASVLLKHAMRLHPHYDEWVPVRLGFSLVAQEKYDEAEELFMAVIASGKTIRQPVQALEGMAVIAVFKGEMEKARDYIAQLLELNPQFSIQATQGRNGFMKDQAFLKRYLDALRQAGLPDKGKQQA